MRRPILNWGNYWRIKPGCLECPEFETDVKWLIWINYAIKVNIYLSEEVMNSA